jgi:leucine dehydrogenase
MAIVRRTTRHVAGLPVRNAAVGGDPSPYTARGVFASIKLAVEMRLARDLNGVRVAVQGVGSVGQPLCQLLAEAGALLTVADVNAKNTAWAERFTGAHVVASEDILQAPVDVLAPCALGAVFDWRTVPGVRASIVCGAANNQLATDCDGDRLAARGIAYIPDYVANAGGIINVAGEHLGWATSEVDDRIAGIAMRVARILADARDTGIATHRVAQAMAERIIEHGKNRAKAA